MRAAMNPYGYVLVAALGIVLFACADVACSQTMAGFHGGLNIADMGGDTGLIGDLIAAGIGSEISGDWQSEKTTRTGAGFGAYVCLNGARAATVQFGAQYVQRGAAFDVSDGTTLVETKLKLDYLEFPVLLRYTAGTDAKVRGVFVAGPVLGIKTSSTIEVTMDGASAEADIGEAYKSTVLGGVVGAGVAVQAGGNTSILFQGRYHKGLTNAFDSSDFESKSGDFAVLAGLEVKLGG